MKTQTRIPADQLQVGDKIIKTFGTNGRSSFEVESIDQDQGWLRVSGYKSVRAGVCGPASATYKHSEMLDVERDQETTATGIEVGDRVFVEDLDGSSFSGTVTRLRPRSRGPMIPVVRVWRSSTPRLPEGTEVMCFGKVQKAHPVFRVIEDETGSVQRAALVVLAAVLPLLVTVAYFTAQMFGSLTIT